MMRFHSLLLISALLAAPLMLSTPGVAADVSSDATPPLGKADAPGAKSTPDPKAGPDAKSAAVEKSTSEQLDDLFGLLSKSHDATEAAGLVTAIDRLHLISGSDTSDLLMTRAMEAMQRQDFPVALQLLDALVALRPQWAEAWNKRATVRYFNGDIAGSMTDIAQTLKRDPRNIGALAGLGAILFDAEKPEEALRAYDRALALAPEYEPLREAETRVKAVLAGRTL